MQLSQLEIGIFEVIVIWAYKEMYMEGIKILWMKPICPLCHYHVQKPSGFVRVKLMQSVLTGRAC